MPSASIVDLCHLRVAFLFAIHSFLSTVIVLAEAINRCLFNSKKLSIISKVLKLKIEIKQRDDKKLVQLSMACFFAILCAGLVSTGTTEKILFFSSMGLVLSFFLAKKKKTSLSAGTILITFTAMLSALVWVSGGIRDIAMLGFPVVLMLAAMIGSKRLLIALFSYTVIFSGALTIATISGKFSMVFPEVTLAHFIYVSAIFAVTALGAYWLTEDSRKLMGKLSQEHTRTLEREKTITELANRDQLTRLYNRRFIEGNFANFIDDSYQEGKKVAIFFIDLDAFKPVNDSLSHTAGDQVLVEVARRIDEISEPEDWVCRFGGDEFLLIKKFTDNGPKNIRCLEIFAEDLLAEIKQPYWVLDATRVEISASVGIAVVPEHGSHFLDIVRSADLAMYDAKDKGRNTFSIFNSDLKIASVDKFNLIKDMRIALKNNGFELWYQPKVDIKTRKIIGCESLVRWPRGDGTYIYPDEFIPAAESSGLVTELGLWILERACQDCADWRSNGHPDVKVAVNISYIQLREGRLPEHIKEILERTGLPPEYLEIELTESLFVADDESNQKQLNEISDMGVSIAIDDFGTGYSNLGYLRRFNARCLKIDRSFISGVGGEGQDEPLVKAIIQMSHSLGLRVIAEGIEEEDSLQKLHELGCDEGQGFLWSPAMPISKWSEYLTAFKGRQSMTKNVSAT